MQAPAVIRDLVPGPRAMLRHSADPGRKPGRTAGGYIDDLAALKKAISLCIAGCARKFNAKGYGYRTHHSIPVARGRCDGCKQHSEQNRLFVHQSSTFL